MASERMHEELSNRWSMAEARSRPYLPDRRGADPARLAVCEAWMRDIEALQRRAIDEGRRCPDRVVTAELDAIDRARWDELAALIAEAHAQRP